MSGDAAADRARAIVLMGPTASGKTALALDWAERFGGEIVSVDSALVYRGLDIGAAKPDAAERRRVPHHMLDLRDPWQAYSAAEFAADARRAVEDILHRGRVPILAGGTGLYFAALLDGLSPMPEADPATRAAIAAEAAELGWSALHARLETIDAEAAARIKPGDAQRIQRALEVHRLTGIPISEWQRRPTESPPFPAQVLSLAIAPADRAILHARIAARFDAMLAAGFLDEVRRLRAMPQLQAHPAPLELPAIRAVGYRQAWEFLDGQGDAATFRERGIAATRQLAKRQFTWLRGRSGARLFDPAAQRDVLDAEVTAFLGRRPG
ncbi:tRNA (adenosine(37)-N6)-dimethylallyltransferase MiaA [Luteimonas chenhongjianii]|uniref:tRNA dimethylallyltransferase n=1 Tax=Luteimonas chenhongjianii TaxID=2006110 RepID=A0A290XFU8_9GAMM|nr:tRNA (adenosine(37)-N6)-dimethylallyltransferase MiaA [Luteimonas chenhongjianii]ATD67943.1 tRNA (adenosine(37)-N6)-dimethylallyltransferase MiaA [Luteimonas chenhongjianii]